MKHLFLSIFISFSFVALAAEAKVKVCNVDLAGVETGLVFDTSTTEYQSLTERWSFRAPNCPSEAILLRLLPFATPDERAAFCLETDSETGAYLAAVRGKRDRFGRCKDVGRACRAVNSAKSAVIATTHAAVNTIIASQNALDAAGISIIDQGSKAVILTGTGGSIAGTMGSLGSSAVAVVSAPETLLGVAAGAVVIGGAILICGT